MENNGSHPVPDPDLAPENSPSGAARTQIGTRRINNTPMVIIFVLMVLFIFVVMAVMYARSKRQIAQSTEQHTSAAKQADSIIPKQLAWSQAPVLEQAPTPVPTPVIQAVLPPPVAVEPPADPVNNARMQALQAALSAKPNVEGVAFPKSGTTAAAPAGENDPEARKLALLRGILARDRDDKAAGDAGLGAAQPPVADLTGLNQFDAVNPHRWQTNARIENPSRFVLRTGSVIPGVLISGVNSELPGTIIAQVSQNVYDTPTGQYLLVPQGSRLIGAYSANVGYGQDRVFIAWQRIVFPDGRALDVGSQPGTDGGGYAGFADQVDNHYLRTFGSAVLLSAVVGGVSYSQQLAQSVPATNANLSASAYSNNGLQQNLSQSLGNVFGNVIAQMIQKNLNVAPTIKIRPGYRFNVLVVKDFEMIP
ncbi:MAG: conjugal transfer protein TrbI, partial [Rhodospirillales bacterium]|nr:conjugal transfer protein TrbI [Acetobacter sp.]